MDDSEQLLGLLVEAVTEYAIFLLDPDGTVRTWNTGAQRLKGYRAEEIVGRHFSVFYPPEDVTAGRPDEHLAAAARDGSSTDDGWRVRADGTRFWAHVVITALRDGDRLRGFAKLTRDDTTARAAHRRADALAEITAALLAGQDTDAVLALVAAHARRLVGGVQAWIAVPGGAGTIRVEAAEGSLTELPTGAELPAAGTIAQRVLDAAEPLFIDDLPATTTAGDRVGGTGAALAVPMLAGSTALGVLVAAAPAGTARFGPTDLRLLRQFADQAAVVIRYDRAQRALRERSVLDDRERIAGGLHTDVIGELSWIAMSLQGTGSYATDPQLRERLRATAERLDATITQIRRLVFAMGDGT